MGRELFRPTPRQIAVLAVTGGCALGFALAMRYLAIENTPLGLACDAGDPGVVCALRRSVLIVSQASAFGAMGLVAALLNLARPSIVLSLPALACASMGLVLYNSSPSAVAIACLALSLARPLPEPE